MAGTWCKPAMELSVLMAVYSGDSPAWLTESLSSLAKQTKPADEIVVVLDGPIQDELRAVLDGALSFLPLKYVQTAKNMGLGAALAVGLKHCTHEIVARMDADDICTPDRFARQWQFLTVHPEVDLLGAWIGEFDSQEPKKIYAFRKVPESHDEIRQLARRRNPFNHMTVMFRKAAVERAGNYRPVRGFEDYDLWARVLRSGSKVWNLQEPLVWARAGGSLVKRRGGISYLGREWLLLFQFYRTGFIGLLDLIVGLTTRSLVRLAPKGMRKLAYRVLRVDGSYN